MKFMQDMKDRLKAWMSLIFGLLATVSLAGEGAQYCVIDLSAGAGASSYPVTYLDAAPSGGFNTDDYKTTKLVLKRVDAGSFKFQNYKKVTLTKSFYMGLFEVTQKQWTLVMGSNPSWFSGDTKPVECVSYNMIRGATKGALWPSENAVDDGSFLSILRTRTGLDFDLPTEAQWEYACRAGTTTTYSYGNNVDGDYMWYYWNSGRQTHEVGTKKPNPWGFYDLHGNVGEWCLDWMGNPTYGTDPKGSSSGSYRALRGGDFTFVEAISYASSARDIGRLPSDEYSNYGFRLLCSIWKSDTTDRSEVRLGDSYRYFVGPNEVKMKDRVSTAIKGESNYASLAIEVLGCADVNVIPEVVRESTAAKLVGTASVKTDAQMKALVYRSGYTPQGEIATCTSGGKKYRWLASLWPDGEVDEDRKWIVVPISCKGSWGGLPSFSVRLKGLDIASGSYFIQSDEDSMPSLNAKSIFGLACTQLGGSSVSGFSLKVSDYGDDVYWMTDEDCKGIAPWWMFDWDENKTESVSMTVKVPEAGLLAIRGYWPNEFGDMHDWSTWQISGVGVSEELPRPDWYECRQGAQLKINCSRATTVTLRNDWDDKFTLADLAFFPASSKSVHVVGDFVVSRLVEDAYGDEYYLRPTVKSPFYVNGYVTGGGTYKPGEKVTMVAVAAPGMKFGHWEITDRDWWDESSEIAFPAGTDTKKKTLSFVVPESFCGEMEEMKVIHVRPVFVEESSGDSDRGDGGDADDAPAPELEASYGPFVPGEKVELEIPELVGWAAKGLPGGLKFNAKTGAITGAAKKPTGDGGATVTFSKKGATAVTTRFVVGPIPTVSVTLAGGTNKCSVAGAGKEYLAGKKVTLTAKAPKGTAFVGWTTVDGAAWPDAEKASVAKQTFEMPAEGLALVATFKEEEVSLACTALAEGSFTVGVSGDAANGLPIEVAADSDVKSVKASKLPGGLKLVKDKETGEWSIVGSPTKAGTYEVVLTVTTAAGSTRQFKFPVTVAPLPAWAVGTFGGMVGRDEEDAASGDEDFFSYGSISLKVAATGRLTAKVTAGGKTYSFSANGFSGYDSESETYWFEMETRAGDVYVGEISKRWHDVATMMQGGDEDTDEDAEPVGAFLPAGWDEPFDAFLWRNEHGKDGRLGTDTTGRAQKAMDAVKALKRVELSEFDPAWGTVAVTIAANGVTKISGTTAGGVKVSQTSFLMLDDDDAHVISDLTFYDRKTGLVYGGAVCWQPIFDDAGNVVGWDDECCNKALRVYPFAPAD